MLWLQFLAYYLFTVAIETPILMVGLSARHSLLHRLWAGLWLTACTYPIVFLVLPDFFSSRAGYLIVAETFAPVAECVLFQMAFGERDRSRKEIIRDCGVIVLANLASFGLGEMFHHMGWSSMWTGG